VKPRLDPRIFLALRFSRTTVERLIAVQDALRGKLTNWHWLEPDGFHLTLRFFGEVSIEMVERIDRACCSLAPSLPTFQFKIDHIDFFGTPQTARVLFASGAVSSEFSQAVSAVLNQFPLPEDQRKEFRPHITLARARKNMEPRMELRNAAVLGKLRETRSYTPDKQPFEINTVHREFCMMETVWVGRSVQYEVRNRYHFGTPADAD
jgi:2'-5' RNA ligase